MYNCHVAIFYFSCVKNREINRQRRAGNSLMLTVIHHLHIFLNLAEHVAALPLMGSTLAPVASRGRVAEFCDGHGTASSRLSG